MRALPEHCTEALCAWCQKRRARRQGQRRPEALPLKEATASPLDVLQFWPDGPKMKTKTDETGEHRE